MSLLGPNGQPVGKPAPAPAPDTQEDAPAAPARVVTAFLVYQLPTGQWIASADFLTPVNPSRQATPDDIIGGSENVKAQLIARQTAAMAAKTTIETQMSIAAQMQEAQQNAAISQMLANGGRG